MTRVLVTGASGFIGRHLCRALVERGDDVMALVRPGSSRDELSALGARFVEGDMMKPDSLRAPVAEVDRVFHLAGMLKVPWRPSFRTVNVEGARNVAAACAAASSPPVLIVVSSLAAAGPSPDAEPRDESCPARPVSVYGQVKLDTEAAAHAFADSVPVSIVRPPMVFGEGDRAMLPLFRQAARGYALRVGPGDRRISLIHVADLAQALIAIAERGQRVMCGSDDLGSGVYFAASEERPTWTELSALMVNATGRTKSREIACPRALLWCAAAAAELYGRLMDRPVPLNLDKYREIVAGSWTCAVDKLGELTVETQSIADRLTSTARWYRERGWLDS